VNLQLQISTNWKKISFFLKIY